MIIVEDGSGVPGANSYRDVGALQFHGSYYRFPIPETEAEQVEYLLRACTAMNAMRWKGHKASPGQPLAWPREGVLLPNSAFVSRTLIPYGIRHGQVMLAIELYCADQRIELLEATHCYPEGKEPEPLRRSCERFMTDPPLWVASRTQFADYLVTRGLALMK